MQMLHVGYCTERSWYIFVLLALRRAAKPRGKVTLQQQRIAVYLACACSTLCCASKPKTSPFTDRHIGTWHSTCLVQVASTWRLERPSSELLDTAYSQACTAGTKRMPRSVCGFCGLQSPDVKRRRFPGAADAMSCTSTACMYRYKQLCRHPNPA